MGGWNGKVRSGGIGSGFPDALHHERRGRERETSVGLVFAKKTPKQRVVTLQLNNHALMIPPGAEDFRVEVQGTLPKRCDVAQSFSSHAFAGKALRV